MPANSRPPRKKRPPRAAKACERCRLKKYKCDEALPCRNCAKSRFECVYEGSKRLREEGSDLTSYIRLQNVQIEDLKLRLSIAESALSKQPSSSIHSQNADFKTNKLTPSPNVDNSIDDIGQSEITDINRHTNATEYHGSSSSLAILGQVQMDCEEIQEPSVVRCEGTPSLISTLHNPGFLHQATLQFSPSSLSVDNNLYVDRASIFIDSYFDSLHYIHPIIDKDDFMGRAKDMWLGHSSNSSFLALYFSVMSLGALVGVLDNQQLPRQSRVEWSRKLFQEAQNCLDMTKFSNDLDIVQCLFLMSKICQNELNPHLAYMYLGLSIRTSLSAGLNRDTFTSDPRQAALASNTWWGIYSLEIEMAFGLGRPDTLGMDDYHSRKPSEIGTSESSIIPCMVFFSQIVRKVSVRIYSSNLPWQEKLHDAGEIQNELDVWVENLPLTIKPDTTIMETALQFTLREPKWCRRQRLITRLRYYNVKTLLFRPFLSRTMHCSTQANQDVTNAIRKCTGSARKTIEIIHETFRNHDFLQTWWYISTHIVFAASVLLLQIIRFRPPAPCGWVNANIKVVDMAVELLEAMDESAVAKRAGELIKHSLSVVKSTTVTEDVNISSLYSGNSPLDPFVPQDPEEEMAYSSLFQNLEFPEFFWQDVVYDI